MNLSSSEQFMLVFAFVGLMFGALAVWLTMSKGNTISDIVNSPNLKDANAIKVEISEKLKIASNIPVVAMFLIAAFVSVGVPGYMIYVASRECVTTLTGQIENYTALIDRGKGQQVWAYPDRMRITPSGAFEIPLSRTEGNQDIVFESPNVISPITLRLQVNSLKKKVAVDAAKGAGVEKHDIDINDNHVARLEGAFRIQPAPKLTADPKNVISTPVPLASIKDVPPIPGTTGQ